MPPLVSPSMLPTSQSHGSKHNIPTWSSDKSISEEDIFRDMKLPIYWPKIFGSLFLARERCFVRCCVDTRFLSTIFSCLIDDSYRQSLAMFGGVGPSSKSDSHVVISYSHRLLSTYRYYVLIPAHLREPHVYADARESLRDS